MCRLVLDETGLLPHVNPGVMTRDELAALREVSASQGIMLETISERLSERGGPHFGSPDKRPAARLATIRPPARSGAVHDRDPDRDRRDAGGADRRAARDRGAPSRARPHPGGHRPELPREAGHEDGRPSGASLDDLLWTAAVARLVLPAAVHVQCPPNLTYDDFPRLLDAGIDDWGGVSPVTIDHVNPEAPWPEIERLREATEAAGLELAPRLPVYPEFLSGRWRAPRVPHRTALRSADADGLAREDGWAAGARDAGAVRPARRAPARHRRRARRGRVARLFAARGEELRRVFAAADALRREVNGDEVSYVVTRNVNYTNVCYFRCGFCAFSKGKLAENLRGPAYLVPIDEIVRRAQRGMGSRRGRDLPPGRHPPGFDGDYYVEVCAGGRRRPCPDLHVHAFSALEVWQGAATLGLPLDEYLARLRDAGLASLPGTAAEILDDEVRRVLCPDKV